MSRSQSFKQCWRLVTIVVDARTSTLVSFCRIVFTDYKKEFWNKSKLQAVVTWGHWHFVALQLLHEMKLMGYKDMELRYDRCCEAAAKFFNVPVEVSSFGHHNLIWSIAYRTIALFQA
jgi:hypothetical protein